MIPCYFQVRGNDFSVNQVEPLSIPIENGPDVLSGEEYIHQLSIPFTFKDETTALRIVKHTLVMKLPPLIPPRYRNSQIDGSTCNQNKPSGS